MPGDHRQNAGQVIRLRSKDHSEKSASAKAATELRIGRCVCFAHGPELSLEVPDRLVFPTVQHDFRRKQSFFLQRGVRLKEIVTFENVGRIVGEKLFLENLFAVRIFYGAEAFVLTALESECRS